jgi:hypothetical protein
MRKTFLFFLLFVALVVPAKAQSHTVTLTWVKSADTVTGYNVYRLNAACPATAPATVTAALAAGFTKITAATVGGSPYTDTGLAAGAYCYFATSVAGTVEGVPSVVAVETAPFSGPVVILPAAPTNVSAVTN